MPTAAELLERTLDNLVTPMTIVTATAESSTAGCLVGLHTQCSIDPMRVGVCISHANHTFEIASTAEALTVHYLEPQHRELAHRFGSETGDSTDKFAGLNLRRTSEPDAVELVDIPARWIGAVETSWDLGDHTMFVLSPRVVRRSWSFFQLSNTDLGEIEAGHPRSA